DRSGDALRDLHLAQVGEARSAVAHARRDDQARRYERRSRADEREERFEEARPTFEDVDEVDAAGADAVVSALDPHERGDGMCPGRAVARRPGATQLTVIPRGPSSSASVFSQPVTAGRSMLESARWRVGSFAASDVIATIRPPPLRSR